MLSKLANPARRAANNNLIKISTPLNQKMGKNYTNLDITTRNF